MAQIRELLECAAALSSDSAALDTELLLSHCLGSERAYLYAWPEREVAADVESAFRELLRRRGDGEPIAYLIGRREFWSLPLMVDRSTLIPRPDTERLVEVALELVKITSARVLDLGTGTGAIALALAKERPDWSICGVDIESDAVRLAAANARKLALANAQFFVSNWFEGVPTQPFDLIVGNPPYIDADDPHLCSGDVRFEPRRALVAERHGLADIAAIVERAPKYLKAGGRLLLEHGYLQGAAVRALFAGGGFQQVATWRDWGERERVSGGLLP